MASWSSKTNSPNRLLLYRRMATAPTIRQLVTSAIDETKDVRIKEAYLMAPRARIFARSYACAREQLRMRAQVPDLHNLWTTQLGGARYAFDDGIKLKRSF